MSNYSGSPHLLEVSPELKLYQAFVFSVPIFFTFILLFLFYLFFVRRRRLDWRMRTPLQTGGLNYSPSGTGLKKEFREMLPIVVYKESFSIRETQCSVCLADYEANERLQQIPSCGHTFHIECIDNWLTKNVTCPLCRTSLLPAAKTVELSTSDGGGVAMEREDDGTGPSEHADGALHTAVNIEHIAEPDQVSRL